MPSEKWKRLFVFISAVRQSAHGGTHKLAVFQDGNAVHIDMHDTAGRRVRRFFIHPDLLEIDQRQVGLVPFFQIPAVFEPEPVGGRAGHFAHDPLRRYAVAFAEQEKLQKRLERGDVLQALVHHPCVRHEDRHLVLHQSADDFIVIIFSKINAAAVRGQFHQFQIRVEIGKPLRFRERFGLRIRDARR